MRREIERDDWQSFLDDFSARNRGRLVQFQLSGRVGAPRVEPDVEFVGVRVLTGGGGSSRVEFEFRDDYHGARPTTRGIPFVHTVTHRKSVGGRAEVLEVQSDSGVRAHIILTSQPDTTAA
jgi:hypothetical protein